MTLDALSRELDVLFIVATGNYRGDADGPGDWRAEYPNYLTRVGASLLDPAPALNAVTVGSIARHERNERWPEDPGYLPVARTGQPSPFTRHGPSVNGAIKPELVDYGGNVTVHARAGGLTLDRQGVGELSISHDFAPARPFAEVSGTSFAAPRVTNAAARILAEHPDASADLCRAMLVAHARTPGACADLFGDDTEALRNVTGYGHVDRSALYRSLEDSVTLWTEESIENRRHHFYEIPLPDEFWEGSSRPREVTVALAFRPAVRTMRIDYRAAFISFKFVRAASLDEVANWFIADIDRGDATRIPEYASGCGLSEAIRSKGTVQASTWTFKRASVSRRDGSWFVVVTRNDPAWGTNLSLEREGYALAVVLNDRVGQELRLRTSRLHAAVERRLRARARLRATR